MDGIWIFLIIVVVGLIVGSTYKSIQGQKQAEKAELGRKYLAIQRQLGKANSYKTAAPQIKSLEKALEILEEVESITGYERIFTDYNKDKAKLKSTIRVLPVFQSWDKAEKFRFKGNDRSEKSNLLDALYEIKKEGITVEDFQLCSVETESGKTLRLHMIEQRLKELGWQETDIATA